MIAQEKTNENIYSYYGIFQKWPSFIFGYDISRSKISADQYNAWLYIIFISYRAE